MSALALVLLAAAPALARPPKPAPPPATRPAPALALDEPSPVLLEKAKALNAELEYDKVIAVTEVLLKRDDLPLDGKLEAHRLNGSAKAIVQDPADAEMPFRLLLRLRPDYELSKDTAPKILAVFRKVQSEERALAQQADLFSREKKIQSLQFLDELPRAAKGGRAVPFSLRLRDPGAAVDAVTVPYRRQGQASWSSLALQRDEEGKWVGQIPAEYTADEKGFTLEYYVESSDAKGPLLTQGTAALPLKLEVSGGAVQSGRPPPVHRKVFFGMLAGTLVGVVASGALGITATVLQREYDAQMGEISGNLIVEEQNRGSAFALAANIGWVITGVLALVTGVLIPLVDWDSSP